MEGMCKMSLMFKMTLMCKITVWGRSAVKKSDAIEEEGVGRFSPPFHSLNNRFDWDAEFQFNVFVIQLESANSVCPMPTGPYQFRLSNSYLRSGASD